MTAAKVTYVMLIHISHLHTASTHSTPKHCGKQELNSRVTNKNVQGGALHT